MNWRVAITGLGAVTPLGHNVACLWNGLMAGRSGVRRLQGPLPDGMPVTIGGQIQDFHPAEVLGTKQTSRNARFTQLALVAAREATDDAGLKHAGYDSDRVGTVLGVGFGGLEWVTEQFALLNARGPKRVSPFALPGLIPNMAASMIAIAAEATGPSYNISSACSSSAHAIGEAYRLIRAGECDVVVTGGSEACLTPLAIAGFARLGALSERNEDPGAASRPFDKCRSGFVMGEGAGILVLERLDLARKRGARIYAELAGYGMTTDAFHPTLPKPDGEGPSRAMAMALRSAGRNAEEVAYINAHGTSTVPNDAMEVRAIQRVFGARTRQIAVSSTKSMIGHLLGAAGAVEAIAAALSVVHGVVHPTLNLDSPDDEQLDHVRALPRERPVPLALSNSFGFGGHNVALAVAAA